MDEPEGVRARRRLMAEGNAEQAAAAGFELGVYFMGRADGAGEAEACFRHVVAGGHPVAAPAALVNLAGLLAREARWPEAESAYREILASPAVETHAMAAYGLGVTLLRQPGREDDAEAALRRAAASGDPEQAPLAAYDLGTLLLSRPGRLDDAVGALEEAARSGHADIAPRAWFNLGAILAQSGQAAEAERAYASAIATGHGDVAPMAAVNLGHLLEQDPQRMADAEDAYRWAMASGHSEQGPAAAANLGNLLAGLMGRKAHAEAAYREAMASGHARQAARAAYNLGVLLLEDPARRADAEAAFREAAVSEDPEHAPRALYNLGRLLAEDPSRHPEAREALAAAAAASDATVAVHATQALEQLDALAETWRLEYLVPPLGGRWRCVTAASQGALHLHEYLPHGQSTGDWEEIVTVMRFEADPAITLEQLNEQRHQDVQARVVDGRLSWETLESEGEELLYESTLQDDVAALDQTELARFRRAGSVVHAVQHAVRGDLARARRERPNRLALLRSARLERRQPPASEPPAAFDGSVVEAVFEGLTAGDSVADREALCQRGIDALPKARDPLRWSLLHLLRGQLILERGDDLDAAIADLRRALEVLTPQTAGDSRARAFYALGFAQLQRAERSKPDAEKSAAAFRHGLAALGQALSGFRPGSLDWARVMVDLGDAQAGVEPEAAAATYAEMLASVENTPALAPEERSADAPLVSSLVVRAVAGIQALDRLRDGMPRIPPGALEREKRGTVLYLRPLLSAGSLRLENRCAPGAFVVGYEREPEEITLEALLYRALGLELSFMTLGGRPEGYGGARFIAAAGGDDWQATLPVLAETAHLVVVVPHVSEGVRWELGYLARQALFPRTLFVMPPLSTDTDTAAMWSGALALMAEHGLRAPAHQAEGAILRFGADGEVAERWEFETLWTNAFLPRIEHLLPGP